VALAAGLYAGLSASLPQLEGTIVASGLSAPVSVVRDAQGVPTLTARNRQDLAWALGYLHAQERFFQMDGLRRAAAGELSDLVGSVALQVDRRSRPHRFRSRATAIVAAMDPAERQLLNRYVEGVNRGLTALKASPFEYLVLRSTPLPWTAEDTLLAVFAMYLSLQEAEGLTERRRANAREVLGTPLAEFLFPEGTSWDAPLDGLALALPEMPPHGLPPTAIPKVRRAESEAPVQGSNGFAVSGSLSIRSAAMVANDMHLGLRVPNTWYRARLIIKEGPSTVQDITGVTLPGTPTVIAGSNGRVTWGFTNAYIDTSDVILLEPVEGQPNSYWTNEGPKELVRNAVRLCRVCSTTEVITLEDSIWGPVVGTNRRGQKLAYRWIAHDPGAVNLRGALELEAATSVREALAIAHRLGIPHQNLVAGDAEGNIGWTVTSPLPRRFGHDGRLPASWADGAKGWSGYLGPEEVPVVYNPAAQRIWTANNRAVGGEALARLGFGAYAHGARARQIRDRLAAQERFSEADLLSIQLDDRGLLLERWQRLMLQALRADSRDAKRAALIAPVANWGGRAVLGSAGYRLVRTYRSELIALIYHAYTSEMPALDPPLPNRTEPRRLPSPQADEPVWRLVTERPEHLVPPGYTSWDAVIEAALQRVQSAIEADAAGQPERFTWGAGNRTTIKHPLSPKLFRFAPLDPPDEPQSGDIYQPRVAAPGFGASERFVVAPGQEASGLFHMPTSQSGHPLSPYYRVGHEAWARGEPTPFLPGQTRWRLELRP
jgi:penicillin amidase